MLVSYLQRPGLVLLAFATACAVQGAGAANTTDSDEGSGGQQMSSSSSSGEMSTGTGSTEPVCPYEGPPLLDVNTLDPCPSCNTGAAHCLPTALVPAEFQTQLENCDADNKCVPDLFIETGGDFIPTSCTSVAGAEGRCLSPCLPDVAKQADQLPQASCASGEVCVPCFDPFDGSDTGACELSCDPGPTEPPTVFPKCCDGHGTCVPSANVPSDKVANLSPEGCPQDAASLVCTPDVYVNDPQWTAPACQTSLLSLIFGDEYGPGACLPSCLEAVNNFMVQQDGCPDNFKCAPCLSPPQGDPSGACE